MTYILLSIGKVLNLEIMFSQCYTWFYYENSIRYKVSTLQYIATNLILNKSCSFRWKLQPFQIRFNRPVHFWSFRFLIGFWVDNYWLMELCNSISDPIFLNKKRWNFFDHINHINKNKWVDWFLLNFFAIRNP